MASEGYTSDQTSENRRILGTNNFYEILRISKTFSESELKKSYRKVKPG